MVREEAWLADIIPFPSRAVRDWRTIEAAIRETFEGTPMPKEGIDAIVARMKPFVELCSRDFSFDVNFQLHGPHAESDGGAVTKVINEFGDEYARRLHQFTSELLFDRLKVEIELYMAHQERGAT